MIVKRFLLLLSSGLIARNTGAQTLYVNGTTVSIGSGSELYVSGDVVNASGSSIENSGNLKVTGNTTNNAMMTGGGTLSFEGSTPQVLDGSADYYASDVIINNPAGVSLNTKLILGGTISFTSGIMNAANSSFPLVFASTASVSGSPGDASHVNGYVVKEGTGSFLFPVGDGIKYQPTAVNLSTNTAGFRARYLAADAGSAPFGTSGASATPLLYYNTQEYWDLTPLGTATGTVTIFWDAYKNGGIASTADLRVAHQTGGQWLNEDATAVSGSPSSGSVTSSGLSTWSPFTLGSVDAASSLPVQLRAFNGYAREHANLLRWESGSESKGTRYTLCRSNDGIFFKDIFSVAGTGNNGTYSFVDPTPANESYYRLRIGEADGTEAFSQTVVLHRAATSSDMALFPVPVKDKARLRGLPEHREHNKLFVYTLQGQLATTLPDASAELDVTDLPAGQYILSVEGGTQLIFTKE